MDYHMASKNSLDEFEIIAASLHDVFVMFGDAFSIRQRKNTLNKVLKRCRAEGLGFLTKSLPKLGKAFDKALTGYTKLNAMDCRFESAENSQLPRFLGELFSLVCQPDGSILPHPNIKAVGAIRQICYLFYKYELPYSTEQENTVVSQFVKTEDELSNVEGTLESIRGVLDSMPSTVRRKRNPPPSDIINIAREARTLLSRVFSSFDPLDITPRHGPGAVATGQRLWNKFRWTNVSRKITQRYPLDAYYYASAGHVCDCLDDLIHLADEDLPARVILVPKDSRGPRLISCEPVDYQWIQQGLGAAIVDWLERSPLTKWNIHFTDQVPNQCGALLGSKTGTYATLDLKEASDRVTLSLVRLLFPAHIYEYLEACRTSATVLPNGSVLKLRKFAPMGSSLCFPILALTIWAILTSAAPDEETREGLLVYGDDVIVRTAFAEDAMSILESFGLLVNRDKSCTSGFFRESCGTDAFQGVNVTPVRLRTVWTSSQSPGAYASWIAYANSLRRRQYFATYELIARNLIRLYGEIPATDMALPCPSLDEVPDNQRPHKTRINHFLQKKEWRVRVIRSPVVIKTISGWSMLLRSFTEGHRLPSWSGNRGANGEGFESSLQAFSASRYTRRDTARLAYRWVSP